MSEISDSPATTILLLTLSSRSHRARSSQLRSNIETWNQICLACPVTFHDCGAALIEQLIDLCSKHRLGRMYRATVQKGTLGRLRHRGNMRQDQGASDEGEQRCTYSCTGDSGWRYTRTVLRYDRDLQDRRLLPGHELSLSWYILPSGAGNDWDTDVMLGDYVDRGLFSVETISLLVCLKLRYPQRVHLIRGNHESRGVTQSYGFYTECSRKYGNANVWHYFTDMFDFLTLSVVINDQIFCVHGGLSPSIHSIDQIKIIDRFREIPHEGPMADLVWSDPDPDRDEFSLSPRGAGYTFGAQVVKKFLDVNSMSHILRAHQLCQEGYQILYDDRLSTVWSAPNYCYRCGNMASVLEVSDTGERYFNVFDAAPENDLHREEQQQQQQQGKDGQGVVVEYFL